MNFTPSGEHNLGLLENMYKCELTSLGSMTLVRYSNCLALGFSFKAQNATWVNIISFPLYFWKFLLCTTADLLVMRISYSEKPCLCQAWSSFSLLWFSCSCHPGCFSIQGAQFGGQLFSSNSYLSEGRIQETVIDICVSTVS